MSGMILSYFCSQPGAYCFDRSTKEEEDEGDDESNPAGDEVHIMTTKVQVSEDTKRVRSISTPTPCRCLTSISRL